MLIAANWKAYVADFALAQKLVGAAKRLVSETKCKIVLAPPAPYLAALARRAPSPVHFAAQDVSATSGGAQTAEIPASIYKAAGASYAIIGHSEKRAMGDTDAVVATKLVRALFEGLVPILCVGELERDTEGHYLGFVREQLTKALEPLRVKDRARLVLAYEPVWAIGKNAAAAIAHSDLTEMVLYIRKVLAELMPGKSSARTLVLYGGSVEPENAQALADATGIDGFLVGHASVDPKMFTSLVRQLS